MHMHAAAVASKFRQGIARAVQYPLSCGALDELTQVECARADLEGASELSTGQREICGDQSGNSVKLLRGLTVYSLRAFA